MKVKFEQPDWDDLADSGRMAVDMHFHTNCSDSFTDVHDLVALAESRRVGFAITDHNLISSLVRIKGLDIGVPVIPGMEVSTTDGPHVLVYFYEMADLEKFWYRCIRPRLQDCPWLALRNCPTEKLLDMLDRENCVVSAAHPMGYLMSNKGVEVCIRKGYLDEDVARRFNAYEVICSGMSHESNISSLAAARRYGIGFTGGTDGHTLNEVGNVVTVSDAEDTDAFLNDVMRHKVSVIGQEKNLPDKARMATASMVKFLRHSPSTIMVQANQTVRSAERGARKAKDTVNEKASAILREL